MKNILLLLLKIPFVFVPALFLWLFFCLLVLSLLLVVQDSTNSENPFPSLKKTCLWVAEFYVNSAKYLAECVR